jgi:hypothetical protein
VLSCARQCENDIPIKICNYLINAKLLMKDFLSFLEHMSKGTKSLNEILTSHGTCVITSSMHQPPRPLVLSFDQLIVITYVIGINILSISSTSISTPSEYLHAVYQ